MDGTVIRAARVADAPQIAVVHVRSWQAAYRGLLPQAYLDELEPAQRVGQWERSLAKADNARNGVLAADNGGMLLGFVGYSPSRDDDRLAETGFVQVTPWALDSSVQARRFYEIARWHADGVEKTDESRAFPIIQVRYSRSLPSSRV
jgi:hypothetical protein